MASRILGVQNALVAKLNLAGTQTVLGQSFTATRASHKKEYLPAETKTLRVDVGCAGSEATRVTRGSESVDYAVTVVVEKKIESLDSEADTLTEFIENIRDFVFDRDNGLTASGSQFVPVGVSMEINDEAYDELRFEAMLSVVYREIH